MKISDPQWIVKDKEYRFIFSQGGLTHIDATTTAKFVEEYQKRIIKVPGIKLSVRTPNEGAHSYIYLGYEEQVNVLEFFNNPQVEELLSECGLLKMQVNDHFNNVANQVSKKEGEAVVSAHALRYQGQFSRSGSTPSTSPTQENKATFSFGKSCG
jgi:hypothetical protein